MAEEMTETHASKESGVSGRLTTKGSRPVRKREPKQALHLVTVTPETKKDSRGEKAPDSTESKCQSAKSGFRFRESLHEAVGKRFKDIIDGLVKIIDEGNPAGAKVLFDALAKLEADPGKIEHQSEVGALLSDLLGPDFQWNEAQQEDQHGDTDTEEAGVEVGSNNLNPEN
jgi:hypothetical protein